MHVASSRPGVDEGLSEPPQARPSRVDQEQGSIPGTGTGVLTSRTVTTTPAPATNTTSATSKSAATTSHPTPKGARGALTGQPLYETNGKEKTLCGMQYPTA